MNIKLSKSGEQPLYLQIAEKIGLLIAQGELTIEEQLPSIRVLAKELEVSIITTKRAYEELEKVGHIYSIPGKGSFVKKQSNQAKIEWKRVLFEEKLHDLLKEGLLLGLTKEEIELVVQVYLREDDEN